MVFLRSCYTDWRSPSRFVGETAFDIEHALYESHTKDCHQEPHVFVAGLARAGTTLLMRTIYETGGFSSLTYRDMPFAIAPNLWQRISAGSGKKMDARERAHGDGVRVDFDSPEALEEVFWRTMTGSDYIDKFTLQTMVASDETIKQFRQYIDLILYRYNGRRYLSKNNNNILRLASISKAFPNAIFLIPYRDPVQHAQSLLKQHVRFCDSQSGDRFVQKYMTWLGHHEFGLDHRPFVFEKQDQEIEYSTSQIEYWISRWIQAYGYLLQQKQSLKITPIFFGYEQFCNQPERIHGKLMERLEVSNDVGLRENLRPSVDSGTVIADFNLDFNLMEKANQIYDTLVEQNI